MGGLSLGGGCWENKMGIQDCWQAEGCEVAGMELTGVCFVHRQGDSSESHRSAQRWPADRGAGPGGGGGFQGELLFSPPPLNAYCIFVLCFACPFVIMFLLFLSFIWEEDTVLTITYFFPYQGPYSDYNNEDLIQKSKHVCATFLDLCSHKEKRNHLPKKSNESNAIWKGHKLNVYSCCFIVASLHKS